MLKETDSFGVRALRKLGIDMKQLHTEIETLSKNNRKAPAIDVSLSPEHILAAAISEANDSEDGHVGSSQLLIALMLEPNGAVREILTRLGVTVDQIRTTLSEIKRDDA
jgi:ATP-dependent Clp protease ATP-binding subunit ClpA